MKILLCVAQFHPIVGGAERQAHALARGLIDRGDEVVVLTRWHRSWARRETIDAIPVRRGIRAINFGPLYTLTYASCVVRAPLGHPGWADAVHTTSICRDVVRDGVDGILVPPEDSDALATEVVKVLADRELVARLPAAARLSVAARHSDHTLNVYGGVLPVGIRGGRS